MLSVLVQSQQMCEIILDETNEKTIKRIFNKKAKQF
jgi:hypothetical protein